MSLLARLPWLAPAWRHLDAYLTGARVPQALLITGRPGVGKQSLALAFAQRLLCRSPAAEACGECLSCRLFAAHSHPDLHRVAPAEAGKPIRVEQIRDLLDRLALKPQYAGWRVVIIAPADAMNVAACNSLLKTLEEPDEMTRMLLLTDAAHTLPATLRSRCQHLVVVPPARDAALAWLHARGVRGEASALLALAQGAPLKALALAESDLIAQRDAYFAAWRDIAARRRDPLAVANEWQPATTKSPPVNLESLSEWMLSWTLDMIRLRAAGTRVALDNPDLEDDLQALAAKLDFTPLYAYLDRLLAVRRLLATQANRTLLLEELLIHWSRLLH